MYIRVPRLGIKCRVVTAKPCSRESGCVPNYPLVPNYSALWYMYNVSLPQYEVILIYIYYIYIYIHQHLHVYESWLTIKDH